MKDYSVLEGLDNNFMIELRCAYDRGYRQGRDDEWAETQAKQKEEGDYNRGVNDLWESVCKFMDADITSDKEIWGCTSWEKFAQLSPSEIIGKLREYNKKQEPIVKCCKNCKHSDKGMVGSTERCESCYYDGVSKANTLFEPMETDSCVEIGDEVRGELSGIVGVVIRKYDEIFEVLMKNGKLGCIRKDLAIPTERHFEDIKNIIDLENADE